MEYLLSLVKVYILCQEKCKIIFSQQILGGKLLLTFISGQNNNFSNEPILEPIIIESFKICCEIIVKILWMPHYI